MGDQANTFEEILNDLYAEFDRRVVEALENETKRLRDTGLTDLEARTLVSVKFSGHAKNRDSRVLKEAGARNAVAEVG